MFTLPTHPRMRHPLTGLPLQAIGLTRAGNPIWPVMGGSQPLTDPASSAPAPATPPAPGGQAPVYNNYFGVPPASGGTPSAPGTQAPPAPSAAGQQPPATTPAGSDQDLGFPPNTPLAEMTESQQLAYWRHQAKKHENRNKAMVDYDDLRAKAEQYDALLATTQSEHEKAVAEARRQGETEAMAKANQRLVKAYVMAAVGDRLAPDSVNAVLDNLDPTKFITNGDVDTDKVNAYAAVIAPPAAPAATAPPTQQPPTPAPATGAAPGALPGYPAPPPPAPGVPPRDLGQGAHPQAPIDYLEAGRAEARRRHRRPTAPAAAAQ